ncbi:pyridoxamine 5'-phosphate oxidase family protein [Candidatus Leptofilum sp.]|uniref:pyridoxamine 5'-phosphate oxidase family protein n=1 Tax=Candidatus Leptofilum sp. TaxID=3241576 RepID=UPI003B592759
MTQRNPRQLALDYLATHQVMTLATEGPEGLWAAAVFYVNDGFDLTFLSAGHTRHARNMTAVPHLAATIQEDYRDWQQIKGIQLEGQVSLLTDVSRETSIARYLQKYPFLAQADANMQNALVEVNWYCLRPERLYFIDNSLGLGHRDEVAL